jgi:hypothetical protein
MRRATWIALIVLLGCGPSEAEREQLRAGLDEEFEAETALLIADADHLAVLINELSEEHRQLDERHAALDQALRGQVLDERDAAMQLRHLRAEADHALTAHRARRTVQHFRATLLRHEEMEKHHADVALDLIESEHERFEEELEQFRRSLEDAELELDRAREQMKAMLAEHEELERRYGVGSPETG